MAVFQIIKEDIRNDNAAHPPHGEAIEKQHRFERVAFAHHGAVEGMDVWDFPDGARLNGVEVDNLVVLGRNAPQPYIVEGAEEVEALHEVGRQREALSVHLDRLDGLLIGEVCSP